MTEGACSYEYLAHHYCWDQLIRLAGMPYALHGGGCRPQGWLNLAAVALLLRPAPLLQSLAVLLPAFMRGAEALLAALQLLLHALAWRVEQRG